MRRPRGDHGTVLCCISKVLVRRSAMSPDFNSLTTFVNSASLVIDGKILIPVAAAQNVLIDVLVSAEMSQAGEPVAE